MEVSRLYYGILRMPVPTLSLFSSVPFRYNARILRLFANSRAFTSSSTVRNATEHLPRVAQPSLWQSMIPKPFRRDPNAPAAPKSKEWNPATIYIVLGLLVGSQAIQLIALRNETSNFSRKADAKIALLREVIERVQQGEKVDVEGLLGTGDKEKEKEWEEVLREIEQEDALWQSKRRGRNPKAKAPDAPAVTEEAVAQPMESAEVASKNATAAKDITGSGRRPGFY